MQTEGLANNIEGAVDERAIREDERFSETRDDATDRGRDARRDGRRSVMSSKIEPTKKGGNLSYLRKGQSS